MKCNCKDWEENIDKVNAPIILQAVRMGGQGGYKGVIFKYCPWCGNNLTEQQQEG